MSDLELRRRLEELHRELSGVGKVDSDLEPLLEELRGDIEAAIGHEVPGRLPGEAPGELAKDTPHTLSERLAAAIERFETSHPQLATAMGAVADQLARMGV